MASHDVCHLLQFAYAANIIILAPVLVSMFCDSGTKQIRAFQNQVTNSEGLRTLVASLWLGILVLSIAGLFYPKDFVAILLLQVVYKLVYLLVYIIPKARESGIKTIPAGLSVCFAAIVIIWPVLIIMSARS